MGDNMNFPATFDEFAEQYKIIDKLEVYTNGAELIPIFRVKQWLDHLQTADAQEVRHGEWISEIVKKTGLERKRTIVLSTK